MGVLWGLALWGWLHGQPYVSQDGAPVPEALGRLMSREDLAFILGAVSLGLYALSFARSQAPGFTPAIESALAASIGTFFGVAAAFHALKGGEMRLLARRFRITLAAFTWDKAAVPEAANVEVAQLNSCPDRFLRMVRGDKEAALQWWDKTKRWRATVRPELLLTQPRPTYFAIKEVIAHYFHKRDRSGRLIYVEVLDAPMQAFRTLKGKGISVDDVVEHMMFMNELCYRNLVADYDEDGVAPKSNGQLIKIMDIRNLGLGDIGGDVSAYFNKISVMGKNYPERMDKIVIVNAPAAFGMIWGIVAPLLDRNVRERISIFRSNYYDALVELIEPENIPAQYGGTCQCQHGCRSHSPEEIEVCGFVKGLNANDIPASS